MRLLTNVSSGRFAAAITEACLLRGARVWHIHSRSAELPLLRFARLDLDAPASRARARPAGETPRSLARSAAIDSSWFRSKPATWATMPRTLQRVLQSQPIDVVILPMAVADFEPEPQAGKISSDRESLVVHCRRTPKVIRLVRDWAPSVYLVGFKLLSDVPERRADPHRDERLRRATAPISRSPMTSRPCARAGTRSIWSGPGTNARRSGRGRTWPIDWSRASSPGRPNRDRQAVLGAAPAGPSP